MSRNFSFIRNACWLGFILLIGPAKAETPDFRAYNESATHYPVTAEHIAIARHIFQALAARDVDWVVARIVYPVKIHLPGKKPKLVTTPRELRNILTDQFSAGLDRRMLDEILEDPRLFSNYQGVMMGSGAVWFVGSGPEVAKMSILAFGVAYQP
jgi:hypothetical protein